MLDLSALLPHGQVVNAINETCSFVGGLGNCLLVVDHVSKDLNVTTDDMYNYAKNNSLFTTGQAYFGNCQQSIPGVQCSTEITYVKCAALLKRYADLCCSFNPNHRTVDTALIHAVYMEFCFTASYYILYSNYKGFSKDSFSIAMNEAKRAGMDQCVKETLRPMTDHLQAVNNLSTVLISLVDKSPAPDENKRQMEQFLSELKCLSDKDEGIPFEFNLITTSDVANLRAAASTHWKPENVLVN